MTVLVRYVEAHPWWTLIYLCVVSDIVTSIAKAIIDKRGGAQ